MTHYLTLLLLFFSISIFSQEGDPKTEKLKMLKMYKNSDEQQRILLLKMLLQICESKDKQNEKMKGVIDGLSQKVEDLQRQLQKDIDPLIVVEKSKDGRFWVYRDKVILDTKTKLEWYVGPPGSIDHYKAEKYVVRGWRLPTINELKKLYEPSKKSGKACIDPVFALGNVYWVWSKELKEKELEARGFDFSKNKEEWRPRGKDLNCRVLIMRSEKH